MKIKSTPKQAVYNMLPKVAVDFLYHNHCPAVAKQVDQQDGLVSIIELEKEFFLSSEEVNNCPASTHLKLIDFLEYEDAEGVLISRIYGMTYSELKMLKENFKIVYPLFKKNRLEKLQENGWFSFLEKQILLRKKSIELKNKLLGDLKNVFDSSGLEIVEGRPLKQLSSFVFLSDAFDNQIYTTLLDLPFQIKDKFLINFYTNMTEETLKSFFKNILNFVFSYLSESGFSYFNELSCGEDLKELQNRIFDKNIFNVRKHKNRKKLDLKINIRHPYGFHGMFFHFQLEEKNKEFILRVEGLKPIPGWIVWQEDVNLCGFKAEFEKNSF